MSPRLEATFDWLVGELDRHHAAAYEIVDVGGRRGEHTLLDDDAVCRAALDGAEALLPLGEVVARVADGAKLTQVRAPEGAIIWVAVALETRALVRYELRAYDYVEGIAWGISQHWPPEGRTLAEALLRTKFGADVQRARRRLEPRISAGQGPGDEVRAIMASAIVEYLLSTQAWQDNGGPAVNWKVTRFDSETGPARDVAWPAQRAIDQPTPTSRRGRLFRAIEGQLLDAGDLQRSRRSATDEGAEGVAPRPQRFSVGSIDAPAKRGSDLTIGDVQMDDAPTPDEQAEMREAAAAERERLAALAAVYPALTERQREVIRRWAKGVTSEEIGQQLGIAPGTVRATVNQTVKKLRRLLAKG